MASHYVSLNRGVEGWKSNNVTTGTSSAAGDHVELRVLDGAHLTKKDVHNIIEQFEWFFEDANRVKNAGFDVSDGKTV